MYTTTTLPLSKVAASEDMAMLEVETAILTKVPDLLNGQHGIRLWEYAMAYQAIQTWGAGRVPGMSTDRVSGTLSPVAITDVGGAGSNFWKLLQTLTTEPITVVDPSLPENSKDGHRTTLEGYAGDHVHGQADVITCISVIEHLEAVRPLLRAAHMLLRHGGLLFLTTDCWDSAGPDQAHFHWMRKRIYNPDEMRKLGQSTRELGFSYFGPTDWHYHGNTVYDYSVASLAMVKR